MSIKSYPIFSVTGIEIEYMLVDRSTLEILPIADKVLQALSDTGEIQSEIEFGNIGISNELALHVLELKSLQPVEDLVKLESEFQKVQQKIQDLLARKFQAVLLPTGAHPWLVPDENIALWPHGSREIYSAFDRIFNCAGHGWVNLQSAHINLPFSNDAEFAQLHNAIRLLMPIIPALTASTPFIEGVFTGNYDSRLTFYGGNQQKLPMISGQVIPEFIASTVEYHDQILSPMYNAIAPFDPDKLLQEEWLNSRGAIARFDRSAIEIRVVDTQESLRQDLACVSAIVSALHYIVKQTEAYLQTPLELNMLCEIYQSCIQHGMSVSSLPPAYLQQFGFTESLTPRQLWQQILESSCSALPLQYQNAVNRIIADGNLAERMMKYYRRNAQLPQLYRQLAGITKSNGYFHA